MNPVASLDPTPPGECNASPFRWEFFPLVNVSTCPPLCPALAYAGIGICDICRRGR